MMKSIKEEIDYDFRDFDDKGKNIPDKFSTLKSCIDYINEHPYILSQKLKYSADK